MTKNTYETWDLAVKQLDKSLASATNEQLQMAHDQKDTIEDLPYVLAAVVLRELYADILNEKRTLPGAEKITLLEDAWAQAFGDDKALPTPMDTSSQVSAWIDFAFLTMRRAALVRLKLGKGDIVRQSTKGVDFEVRSIGRDGRVYFVGGYGQRAWPDQLEIVERHDPDSKSKSAVRRKAENKASEQSQRNEWSMARHESIAKFRVPREPNLDTALAAAHDVLSHAVDERPMQTVFASHPGLLTSLLNGGHGRYLWDRPELGSQFVPDFILADVDSAGIHYKLVELESPNARVFLKDGQWAKEARKGIAQIQEWRQWLQDNIAYARATANGCGLIDIDAFPPGLLIVGRQAGLPADWNEKRRQLQRQNNIEIRTYDGILESIASLPGR